MTDTTALKATLEEKLKTITSDLASIGTYNEQQDNWEAVPDKVELTETDENSEADAVEEWNERRATLSALETEYRNIKRALAKIEAGTFGLCEISGEPIEPERLSVNPTARTCAEHREEESSLPL